MTAKEIEYIGLSVATFFTEWRNCDSELDAVEMANDAHAAFRDLLEKFPKLRREVMEYPDGIKIVSELGLDTFC